MPHGDADKSKTSVAPLDNPLPAPEASGVRAGAVTLGLDEKTLERVARVLSPTKPPKRWAWAEDVTRVAQLAILVGGVLWGGVLYLEFDRRHKIDEKISQGIDIENKEWRRLDVQGSGLRVWPLEHGGGYGISFTLNVTNMSGVPVVITRNVITMYAGHWARPLAMGDAGAILLRTPPNDRGLVQWTSLDQEPFPVTLRQGWNTGMLGSGQGTSASYNFVASVGPDQWIGIRSDLCVHALSDDAGVLAGTSPCDSAHNQTDVRYCLIGSHDSWSCIASDAPDGGSQ